MRDPFDDILTAQLNAIQIISELRILRIRGVADAIDIRDRLNDAAKIVDAGMRAGIAIMRDLNDKTEGAPKDALADFANLVTDGLGDLRGAYEKVAERLDEEEAARAA